MSRQHSRPALVLALSCSLAGASPQLTAQTAAPNDPSRDLREVIAQLDALFDEGDVHGYLAAFRPDNPWAHAARQRRLGCLLSADPRPRRTSTLVGDPLRMGDRTVVRVHHELRREQGGNAVVWSEDTVLALQKVGDGASVATFEVPISATGQDGRDGAYRCPPCNYAIGGAEGWLCVPMERDCGWSLEAVGFWFVGTDIVCEISVNVDTDAPAAEDVARLLAESLCVGATKHTVSAIAAWLPPAHRDAAPRRARGARIEITTSDELAAGGMARSVLHVLTIGPLQHILLARGSEASMLRHEEALDRLLLSYRLTGLEGENAVAGYLPVLHHTGGKLDGVAYHNELFRLDCTGPAGWQARHRCGGAAFRVLWTNDRRGSLELVGYRRPAGIDRWTTDHAEVFVRHSMANASLTPCQGGASFEWKKDVAVGGVSCCVTCTPAGDQEPGGPKRRLHIVVRDDVLLVFDARVADPADESSVIAAMQTLVVRQRR